MSWFHLPSLKTSLLTIGILMIPVFTYLIWNVTNTPTTLSTLDSYATVGTSVKQDFQLLPTLPFTQEDTTYTMTDTTSDGIDIQFANATEPTLAEQAKPKLNLSFPKDYAEPIEVKLDNERTIKITDLGGKSDYTVDTLSQESSSPIEPNQNQSLWQRIKSLGGRTSKEDLPPTYLRYTSQDERKSLLYAFQKDQATGEKKLKHWTLYQEGTGLETEEYRIENAKVRINEGKAEVFYYGEQDLKNDQAVAEVDTNLLERAQRTLAKEMGEDIMNGTSGKTPDFTIPEPYYLDRNGEKHAAEWKWDDEASTLSVTLTPSVEQYPIALDPTLSFTAPGVSNGGSVISGEATGNQFGTATTMGDFNADGRVDLVVTAPGYSTSTGRTYIFYNDGALSTTANSADVIITGEGTNHTFGHQVSAGDWNTDGKMDLAVTANSYTSTTGRIYLFYNDGVYPSTAASADVIITGEGTANRIGWAKPVVADLNADGRNDLALGAWGYSSGTGRAYIFYGGSITTENASGADVIITGEASSNDFGYYLTAGDLNADGEIDLVVAADYYSARGRAYIFYNDGAYPSAAASADVTINAEAGSLLTVLVVGDLNADGKTDLVIGSPCYSGCTGRAYIFYNDGTYPSTADAADVIITGEAGGDLFAYEELAVGDFNADGRTDLVVSAQGYSSNTGRIYLFYNDGAYPSTAASADVIITGEGTSNYFGQTFATGDMNADGKTDLVVGAYGNTINRGRAYIFYSQNGQVNTNQSIVGNATSDEFGKAMATGDFNADGRTDLAVGAPQYSSGSGRAYLFYGDGQIPTTAVTADIIISGEASSYFGTSLTSGDFNADGKTDLAIGATNYSSSTGRTYLFYNDGSIPTTAATADVTITGETTSNYFGDPLTSGDFNADGKIDLAVGSSYSSATGRTYIFYNGSIITENASGADVIITGETTSNHFGAFLTGGDFNADGKTDLAVSAYGYSSNTGRVYLFYNGSIITENASGADVIITGDATEDYFGFGLVAGDLNTDGRIDLATYGGYSSGTSKVFIFYNDGAYPATSSSANVTINSADTSGYFGSVLVTGDFNADGRIDLVVGEQTYSSSTGRVYVFYNDGSLPTTAATADVTITGETTNNHFGSALATGDMNADGRTDLIVGAYGNTTNTGKVYFYETRENFAWEIQEQSGTTPRTGTNGSGQEMQITGEVGSYLGSAMTTGDFNADGRTDLAISASSYSSSTGRVYMFYADGSLPNGANNADVVIVGEASSAFGNSLSSADLNTDGKIDLVVGANSYSSSTGRVYVFYNDGSYPGVATLADVIITGGATDDQFGEVVTSGDFNADGSTDLAVGAWQYSFNVGRAYIFYGGSIITEGVGGADVIITGEGGYFSSGALTAGDFNADGRTDLAVGAYFYSSAVGRAYLFYGGSIITENASGADVIINGEAGTGAFGARIISGDLNADGKTDLAVGAWNYSSSTGRVYVFHADGTNNFGTATCSGTPAVCSAGNADAIITGETTSNQFGGTGIATGDFNADGKTDLVVGSNTYSSSTGRAYIFYNGSIITESASGADTILTGEATGNYFGQALTSGDLNADGKIDLIVSGYGYQTNRGKVYFYTFNDPVITGETTNNYFGTAMATGDFNADGRADLAVAATNYSSGTGRVYVFYQDGSIPATAATADAIITGETTSNYFGTSLAVGDLNSDGKVDLAVGARGYSSDVGRAYIFYNGSITTENASGADVIISSSSGYFGSSMATGDLNSDGKVDLAVGAAIYNSRSGATYIFHNDGSMPTTTGTADVTITSDVIESTFGSAMVTGDFNADGKTDLAVGCGSYYGTEIGYVYIFHNDGSIPTTVATADVTIASSVGGFFGSVVGAGDFNADGRTDLAVGHMGQNTAYLFYNDGSIPTTTAMADATFTGNVASDVYFGSAIASGDFNADGRTDLVIGSKGTNSAFGKVYTFYNDGSYPSLATSADTVVTSDFMSFDFGLGYALATGDFNADGKIDIAAAGPGYSTNTGRVYLFSSEVAGTSTPPGTSYLKGTGKLKGTMKWK